MNAVEVFRKMIEVVPDRLRAIPADTAAQKSGPDSWSRQEELGHLLDSTVNNHQRLVRVLRESNPTLSSYGGEFWVETHVYQRRDWKELIDIWRALNAHFLMAVESVDAAHWSRPCVFDDLNRPATLSFVFEDYLAHAIHHLQHIGITTDDFAVKKWQSA